MTWVMLAHGIAQSKLTSQRQISVPAEVRRTLGLVTGSVLEWDEEGGTVLVRRVGEFSSADIHTALFAVQSPAPRSIEELKSSAGRHLKAQQKRCT
jgi:AbrB family looped-hinge helix DNA binding protein